MVKDQLEFTLTVKSRLFTKYLVNKLAKNLEVAFKLEICWLAGGNKKKDFSEGSNLKWVYL